MFSKSDHRYVPTSTDEDDVISTKPTLSFGSQHLLAISGTILGLLVGILAGRYFPSAKTCLDMGTIWSPANEAINRFVDVRMNGSFAVASPYKGPATDATDKLWKELTNARPFVLSKDDLVRLGVNPEYAVRYPEHIADGYFGELQVSHLLHCLFMLWQSLNPEYYSTSSNWQDKDVWHRHLEHCIDLIRQDMMCTANTGVLPYIWVENITTPEPYFDMKYRCRDMDSLRKWEDEHSTGILGSTIQKPSGVKNDWKELSNDHFFYGAGADGKDGFWQN